MRHLYSRYLFLLLVILLSNSCRNSSVKINEDTAPLTQEELIEINRQFVKENAEDIKNYIKRNSLEMLLSNSGLWYMLVKEVQGEKVVIGQVVSINYHIKLLDGTLCYSSDELGPKTFKVGSGNVEKGLEEGILMMSIGDIMKFIMPPHLSHGLVGDGKMIPAKANLVYEVELLSIK